MEINENHWKSSACSLFLFWFQIYGKDQQGSVMCVFGDGVCLSKVYSHIMCAGSEKEHGLHISRPRQPPWACCLTCHRSGAHLWICLDWTRQLQHNPRCPWSVAATLCEKDPLPATSSWSQKCVWKQPCHMPLQHEGGDTWGLQKMSQAKNSGKSTPLYPTEGWVTR